MGPGHRILFFRAYNRYTGWVEKNDPPLQICAICTGYNKSNFFLIELDLNSLVPSKDRKWDAVQRRSTAPKLRLCRFVLGKEVFGHVTWFIVTAHFENLLSTNFEFFIRLNKVEDYPWIWAESGCKSLPSSVLITPESNVLRAAKGDTMDNLIFLTLT